MDSNSLFTVIVSIIVAIVIVHFIFDLIGRNRTLQDMVLKANQNPQPVTSVVVQTPASSKENTYSAKPLTIRELQVAELVVEGLENKEIGVKLKISPYTVNNHLENIKEKTSCRNRAELVSYLLKNGIVS